MPALLISASMRPNRFTVARTKSRNRIGLRDLDFREQEPVASVRIVFDAVDERGPAPTERGDGITTLQQMPDDRLSETAASAADDHDLHAATSG